MLETQPRPDLDEFKARVARLHEASVKLRTAKPEKVPASPVLIGAYALGAAMWGLVLMGMMPRWGMWMCFALNLIGFILLFVDGVVHAVKRSRER
jgi:hypothetical protein